MSRRTSTALALALAGALALAACGGSSSTAKPTTTTGLDPSKVTTPATLRLGYFPNVTHAPALVGIQGGGFSKTLGPKVTLEPKAFNAGPEAVQALFSGALDASFIGPSPSITAYQQSQGKAIRIVAGAALGGAYLVVKPEITKASDLKGKKVSSPQLGNTQDVALRTWLDSKGLTTNPSGGGDVSIVPQENSLTLQAFKTNQISGAWVVEPWATRLVEEGGGKVLIDEADLWPKGRYVTTNLIVRTEYLEQHPDVIRNLIRAESNAIDLIAKNPTTAKTLTNQAITAVTTKALPQNLIDASFAHITFTLDPVPTALRRSAKDAQKVGLLGPVNLNGIYELSLLNGVLKAQGKAAIVDTPEKVPASTSTTAKP
jgi:NitT/TauT family transport system substrate-binding protein